MNTYYLGSTTADLAAGVDFNKYLELTTEGSSSISVTVSPSATQVSCVYTRAGEPGTRGATGDHSVEVNVTTANSNIFLALQLHRINSAGTIQASSSISAEQNISTTGVKNFSFTALDLGTWASGDRLRVDYRFRSAASHGNNSVTIETGTTNTEHVTPYTPGTTPVQQDIDLRWDVLTSAQQDNDLRWDVIAGVQQDVELQWNMEGSVQQDIDLRWNMDGTVQQDVDFRYNILNPVQQDSDLRWNLLTFAQQDSDLRWNITSGVQQDIDFRWDLKGVVHQDLDARWNVLNPIQQDVELQWGVIIIGSIQQDLSLLWHILSNFTFAPSYSTPVKKRPRLQKAQFEEGDYAQRAVDGINSSAQVWNLVFNDVTNSIADSIEAFLEFYGGSTPFDWTPPGGYPAARYVCATWNRRYRDAIHSDMTMTFEQSYALR